MKKRTPTIYLVSILLLLLYGFVGNYLVFSTQNSALLATLNHINITITFLWFFFNCFMIFFFRMYKYEKKSVIFATYYVLIGLFNISQICLHYISNYTLLFLFSLGTKTTELIIALFLLRRNLRSRMFLGKL